MLLGMGCRTSNLALRLWPTKSRYCMCTYRVMGLYVLPLHVNMQNKTDTLWQDTCMCLSKIRAVCQASLFIYMHACL